MSIRRTAKNRNLTHHLYSPHSHVFSTIRIFLFSTFVVTLSQLFKKGFLLVTEIVKMRRRKREREKNLLLVHFPFLVHRTKKNRKIENVVEKSILNGTSSSSPGPRRVIVFPHKSHVETYLLLLIWCFLLHNPPVRACLSLSLFLETEKRVVAISTTAKREEGSLRRFLLLAFSLKRPNTKKISRFSPFQRRERVLKKNGKGFPSSSSSFRFSFSRQEALKQQLGTETRNK